MLLEEITQTKLDMLADTIKRNCSEYLSQTKKPLFRGMTTTGTNVIYHARTNRKPTDMDQDVHDILDQLFIGEFGIAHRSSSVFTTGNHIMAASFAGRENTKELALVIPLNGFQFAWSPKVIDLFSMIPHHLSEDPEELKEEIAEIYQICEYVDTNLDTGVKSGREVMLNCPKGYIALSYNLLEAMGIDVFKSDTHDREVSDDIIDDGFLGATDSENEKMKPLESLYKVWETIIS